MRRHNENETRMEKDKMKNRNMNWKTLAARLAGVALLALLAAAPAAAQDQKVTLTSRTISLEQAFGQIEAQTGLLIGYKNKVVDLGRTVTVGNPSGTAKEVLGRLLQGTELTWMYNGSAIIITPKPQPRQVVEKPAPAPEPEKPAAVRGAVIPAQTRTFTLAPEPQPVPAPKGGYETARRLTETPHWALKTNLLWDATASVWLAPEVRLGHKTTLDLPVMLNWWDFKDNTKWKHTLFQPGVRFWSCEAFNGFFWGLHAHGGVYNVGHVPDPPFSAYANAHRFEGWLIGGGASVGYQWILGKRWGLEAEAGAGYAYLDYKTYNCINCGKQVGAETKHYFGPTKASLSLVFMIK